MNNLNSVLIEGALVADPELSYTAKGTAECKFTIEVMRSWKQDEEEQNEKSFFDVTCRTRLAEVCAEYLKKGRGVRVVGRLRRPTVTEFTIVAEHVEFKPAMTKADREATAGVTAKG